MTVNSETSRVTAVGITAGVGVAVAFPIYAVEDVTVLYGADIVAALGTHYSVTLDPPNYLSATVTPTQALVDESDGTITVARRVPFVQTLNIPVNHRLPETGIVRALDYFCFMAQQLYANLAGTIRFPSSENAEDFGAVPDAADRANKFWKWDADGKPTAVSVLTTGAISVAAFGETLLTLASAALWRAALAVPGLNVNNIFAGNNTFTGDNEFTQPVTIGDPTDEHHAYPAGQAWAIVPTGQVVAWMTDNIPAGFMICDGSALSRSTYNFLFDELVTNVGFTLQTFTITIAAPGRVTKVAHGFTGGERLRLSTTGALPTGLLTTVDYFVIVDDADHYWLATTEANAAAGTKITTSGSQSGTQSYTRSLYGLGDGATTFNLPDLRNLFPRGRAASGRALGSYEADGNKAHTHTVQYQLNTLAAIGTGNNIDGPGGLSTTSSSGGTEAVPKNRSWYWIMYVY